MAGLLEQIRSAVSKSEYRFSYHAVQAADEDGLLLAEIVEGVGAGEMIEEYPDHARGPCLLALQRDRSSKPVHVVWGFAAGTTTPAIIITVYRPDVLKWSVDFRTRRK